MRIRSTRMSSGRPGGSSATRRGGDGVPDLCRLPRHRMAASRLCVDELGWRWLAFGDGCGDGPFPLPRRKNRMRTAAVGPRPAPASGPSCARDSVRRKRAAQSRAIHDDPRHAAGAVPSTGGRALHGAAQAGCCRRSWMTAGAAPYRRSAGYGARVDGRAYRQATTYMPSTDRAWPFSFANLCEALGLDAGCLRQELQREPGA